jgi:hypothetical protein
MILRLRSAVITASNEIVTPSVSAFINLPDNVCYLNDKGIVIWIDLVV